jgi:hypothetical protein
VEGPRWKFTVTDDRTSAVDLFCLPFDCWWRAREAAMAAKAWIAVSNIWFAVASGRTDALCRDHDARGIPRADRSLGRREMGSCCRSSHRDVGNGSGDPIICTAWAAVSVVARSPGSSRSWDVAKFIDPIFVTDQVRQFLRDLLDKAKKIL